MMWKVLLRAAAAVSAAVWLLCSGSYAPPAAAFTIIHKPRPKGAEVVAVETFGAWKVECLKYPPPAKGSKYPPPTQTSWKNTARLYKGMWLAYAYPCHVSTEFNLQKNPLLPVKISVLVAARRGDIEILALFPPRYTLAAVKGPTLKLGEMAVPLHAFRTCKPESCGALGRLPLAKLGQIEKSKSIVLALPDLPGGKPAEIIIPVAGFPAALEAQRKLEAV